MPQDEARMMNGHHVADVAPLLYEDEPPAYYSVHNKILSEPSEETETQVNVCEDMEENEGVKGEAEDLSAGASSFSVEVIPYSL